MGGGGGGKVEWRVGEAMEVAGEEEEEEEEEVGVEEKPKGKMCAYVHVRTIHPQCLSLVV